MRSVDLPCEAAALAVFGPLEAFDEENSCSGNHGGRGCWRRAHGIAPARSGAVRHFGRASDRVSGVAGDTVGTMTMSPVRRHRDRRARRAYGGWPDYGPPCLHGGAPSRPPRRGELRAADLLCAAARGPHAHRQAGPGYVTRAPVRRYVTRTEVLAPVPSYATRVVTTAPDASGPDRRTAGLLLAAPIEGTSIGAGLWHPRLRGSAASSPAAMPPGALSMRRCRGMARTRRFGIDVHGIAPDQLAGLRGQAERGCLRGGRRLGVGHRHLDLSRHPVLHAPAKRCRVAGGFCERAFLRSRPDGSRRSRARPAGNAGLPRRLPERGRRGSAGCDHLARRGADARARPGREARRLDVRGHVRLRAPPRRHGRDAGRAPDLRRSESDMAAVLLRQAGCSPKDLLRAPAFRAWLADRREVQEQGGGSRSSDCSPKPPAVCAAIACPSHPGPTCCSPRMVSRPLSISIGTSMEGAHGGGPHVRARAPWRLPPGISRPRWIRTRSAFRALSSATTPPLCSSGGKQAPAQRISGFVMLLQLKFAGPRARPSRCRRQVRTRCCLRSDIGKHAKTLEIEGFLPQLEG